MGDNPIQDWRGLLARYWGKADPAAALIAGRSHHTVLGHSLDVAACAYVLLSAHPALSGQLTAALKLPCHRVGAWVALACALHDFGKLDTRFQQKAPAVALEIRPGPLIESVGYDHGTEGFRIACEDVERGELCFDALGPNGLEVLRAVCGHHGDFPSNDRPDPSRVLLPRSLREEDASARRTFARLMVRFFASIGAEPPPETIGGPIMQRIGGICALSDWIGSNVQYFRYQALPADLDLYWASALAIAEKACRETGLLRAPAARRTFRDLYPTLMTRDVQTITESLELDSPALVIVEAEMGRGKTEAAISLAGRFLGTSADGITLALPTMATSNAMFRRVLDVVPALFPGGDVQVTLAHGRARRNPAFASLVDGGFVPQDREAPEASVVCARWFANRKRVLLAQVGVGTIDQALQAALRLRHQFVRLFGLSRNVVIIDEVHAYDAYMEVLLEHLLHWLGSLGVPVILLSATLPSERRAALGAAWSGREVGPPETEPAAAAAPYPLVTVVTPERTTFHAGHEPPESKTVKLARVVRGSEGAHEARTADRLLDAAAKGGRVVWIRNTVGEAQRAFEAVESRAKGVDHLLFHSRFRGCDRSLIENRVLDRFGKESRDGCVLIATQVVEQSLDIDFDEMDTDLAPVDLVLQRLGRLHRHERRTRPLGPDRVLRVHLPSDEDVATFRFGPSAYVYDLATLWITAHELKSRDLLHLPTDIRPLIERVYHPTARARLIAQAGGTLVETEVERVDLLEKKRTKAKRSCIPDPDALPLGETGMDDDEDAVGAFTRDGRSTTVLPVWWDGGLARAIDSVEDTPAWDIDPKARSAWSVVDDLLDQTLSVPSIDLRDATNLSAGDERWIRWLNKFTKFAAETGIGRNVVPIPLRRSSEGHQGLVRYGGRFRRARYSPVLGLQFLTEEKRT